MAPAGLLSSRLKRGREAPGERRTTGNHTMTTKQYLAALKSLGLKPSGKATAEILGLSLRQCQRIAAGESAVPGPLAKLLHEYLRRRPPAD